MTEIVSRNTAAWTFSAKISFRFAFILILAFVLLMNNGAFPFFTVITQPVMKLVEQFVPWFSEHILHYQYDFKILPNGSGDTSFSWVLLFIMVVIAAIGSIVWSILDRKRKSYNTCHYWLRVVVRYYLACMLINYGVIKMMHAQMPPPTLHRLMEPLGEFSPMGLAWTFFGFSKEYSFFVGLVEVLSAFLFFRKTVVLGALITVATAINVMSVNYFFDVPVKMLSTALFVLALFLLIPHLQALYQLLIKGEAATLVSQRDPIFDNPRKRIIIYTTKAILMLIFGITQVTSTLQRNQLIQQYYKKSPLHGIYRITPDDNLHESIPATWRSIVFEFEGSATVRDIDYQPIRQQIQLDTAKRTISLNNFTFDYQLEENGNIRLRKIWENETEEIKLIKINPTDFELKKQGFRWIQEYPNNR